MLAVHVLVVRLALVNVDLFKGLTHIGCGECDRLPEQLACFSVICLKASIEVV